MKKIILFSLLFLTFYGSNVQAFNLARLYVPITMNQKNLNTVLRIDPNFRGSILYSVKGVDEAISKVINKSINDFGKTDKNISVPPIVDWNKSIDPVLAPNFNIKKANIKTLTDSYKKMMQIYGPQKQLQLTNDPELEALRLKALIADNPNYEGSVDTFRVNIDSKNIGKQSVLTKEQEESIKSLFRTILSYGKKLRGLQAEELTFVNFNIFIDAKGDALVKSIYSIDKFLQATLKEELTKRKLSPYALIISNSVGVTLMQPTFTQQELKIILPKIYKKISFLSADPNMKQSTKLLQDIDKVAKVIPVSFND